MGGIKWVFFFKLDWRKLKKKRKEKGVQMQKEKFVRV